MKYLMYFLVGIPWAITLFVIFVLTGLCLSEGCHMSGSIDFTVFSVIGIVFIFGSLWLQFFIISLFRDWLPFKIKNDGNAQMTHFGWVNLPLIILGGGFGGVYCAKKITQSRRWLRIYSYLLSDVKNQQQSTTTAQAAVSICIYSYLFVRRAYLFASIRTCPYLFVSVRIYLYRFVSILGRWTPEK